MDVKGATAPLRHKIVELVGKLFMPNLYSVVIEERASVESVPRPMISFVKAHNSDTPLIGVEIGVYEGINAKSILETLNIAKLYLIDPYEPYNGARERGMLDMTEKTMIYTKEIANKKLMKFRDKIKFVCMTSDNAVDFIPDNLDFVYIDGNHDYEFVKRDILNYYSKVKEGGVLGGHNYWVVARAVCEFVKNMNLDYRRSQSDWWIVK